MFRLPAAAFDSVSVAVTLALSVSLMTMRRRISGESSVRLCARSDRWQSVHR